MNQSDSNGMSQLLSDWRAAGIIVDTESPYAAPGFLVGRKDGARRPIFNYRRLNAQTFNTYFPIPNIDDHLAALSSANYFTILDLARGYLQIPLSLDAQKKTAFITADETGQFTHNFCKRNPSVVLRTPEARAKGFNKPQVQRFFKNLEAEMDKNSSSRKVKF